MALQLALEIANTGVTLNYWRIIDFSFSVIKDVTCCTLAGYPSKDVRDSGKLPLDAGIRHYQWSGSDNPLSKTAIESGTSFAVLYSKITQSVPSELIGVGQTPVETNPFVSATSV